MDSLPFHEMGLDDRILKAIADLRWKRPTLIQEKAIPLSLEGKDILARAKTGSGKTGAYAIPLVQRVLERKSSPASDAPRSRAKTGFVQGLVLVPSKELSQQAAANVKAVSSSCSDLVGILDISNLDNVASQRAVQVERPDIVVGTPSRVLSHLKEKAMDVKVSLQVLVMDEADLLFSYGYEEDLKALLSYLPPAYQAFLMSATLSEEVVSLKGLLLHNPAILKLEDSDLPEETRLVQYHIRCSVEDKFLLIYALLKLKLVSGKTLLFVNSQDRCYRLKLFLEQFSIKSCVLNSELPHNSRCHVVKEFNRGIYEYIIATEESKPGLERGGEDGKGISSLNAGSRKRKRDKEYSVARGIDFQEVRNVVNFDCPLTVESYVHRVGRTARGHDSGAALTFVTPAEEGLLGELEARLKGAGSEASGSSLIKPYKFHMSEIEGFRYRVKDAMRGVTKASVKEARLKEVRMELLNSKRLQAHFEQNPRDLQVLRHDRTLQPTRVQPHLKHIPPYLVPKALRGADVSTEDLTLSLKRRRRGGVVSKKHGRKGSQRRKDPLRTYGRK